MSDERDSSDTIRDLELPDEAAEDVRGGIIIFGRADDGTTQLDGASKDAIRLGP